jgi:hypothetical protein
MGSEPENANVCVCDFICIVYWSYDAAFIERGSMFNNVKSKPHRQNVSEQSNAKLPPNIYGQNNTSGTITSITYRNAPQ